MATDDIVSAAAPWAVAGGLGYLALEKVGGGLEGVFGGRDPEDIQDDIDNTEENIKAVADEEKTETEMETELTSIKSWVNSKINSDDIKESDKNRAKSERANIKAQDYSDTYEGTKNELLAWKHLKLAVLGMEKVEAGGFLTGLASMVLTALGLSLTVVGIALAIASYPIWAGAFAAIGLASLLLAAATYGKSSGAETASDVETTLEQSTTLESTFEAGTINSTIRASAGAIGIPDDDMVPMATRLKQEGIANPDDLVQIKSEYVDVLAEPLPNKTQSWIENNIDHAFILAMMYIVIGMMGEDITSEMAGEVLESMDVSNLNFDRAAEIGSNNAANVEVL